MLTGDGETGAALVEAGVDKIAFTGSVATGRKVALACARQLIPCTLELGGKDPMIVCADADLDVAAGGAVAGAFFNTGQYCCGTERVYVVESVADAFTRKVVERTAKLRQGDHGEFDVGAVFWGRQLEIIEEHVRDAVAKGAKVLVGGRRNPNLRGLYLRADGAHRRDARDARDARGDLRARAADRARRERRRGDPHGERLRLRALRQRLDAQSAPRRRARAAHPIGQRVRERHGDDLRRARGALRRAQARAVSGR